MPNIKVTVTKVSAQASKNGNFIHTLKTEGKKVVIPGLGEKTSNGVTYFMATKTAATVGTVVDLPMDQLKVTESDYVVKDAATGQEQTLKLKWLSVL